ncbi:MAG: class I SAM-dependent methyltransferase [Planctomycetes bacterium]|nr:class I SAM-dependent methyltransferase [Planctomycetota bacterium]
MSLLDRHNLYERCTQTPERDVKLLRAIHGGTPRTLGEDFAGTAALSRAWVRLVRSGRAIATDHDGQPLAHARGIARLTCRVADVRAAHGGCDVIAAFNFSIGELHDRAALCAYLRRAHHRLPRGGIFACDLYGGSGAFRTGTLRERHALPDGARLEYSWEQRAADALTGRVVNALHFRVTPRRGRRVETLELRDAFVYDWRLWSLPELQEALREAGFTTTEVWSRFEHAVDGRGRVHPLRHRTGGELADDWCVFVVGRRR